MRDLQESDIKALADSAGLIVPQEDLPALAARLNGMLEIAGRLESLPLDGVEPIPTALTQRGT